MRDEYDFSKGERGKFYHPGAELRLPVYLDAGVQHAGCHRQRQGHRPVGVRQRAADEGYRINSDGPLTTEAKQKARRKSPPHYDRPHSGGGQPVHFP